jgi:hypothetical protein
MLLQGTEIKLQSLRESAVADRNIIHFTEQTKMGKSSANTAVVETH